jgi:hypothetical protein
VLTNTKQSLGPLFCHSIGRLILRRHGTKSLMCFSNASEKCSVARDYHSTGNEWNFHKGLQREGLNSTSPFKDFEFGREDTSVALKKE